MEKDLVQHAFEVSNELDRQRKIVASLEKMMSAKNVAIESLETKLFRVGLEKESIERKADVTLMLAMGLAFITLINIGLEVYRFF